MGPGPAAGQAAGNPTSSNSSAPPNRDSASQSQTPPAPPSTQASPPASGQKSTSPAQAKPSPTKPRRRRKTIPPNCSNAPAPLNSVASNPNDPAKPADAGSTDAGSTNVDSAKTGSAALPPCPPPKKVIRNGGSDEPAIQLVGGTTAEQASHQRSTAQLTAATEENLKKIEGRQLNPSQQEMVSQIKQFMQQSKAAVAAGDLEGGHNLAMKAHLLSEELVKP